MALNTLKCNHLTPLGFKGLSFCLTGQFFHARSQDILRWYEYKTFYRPDIDAHLDARRTVSRALKPKLRFCVLSLASVSRLCLLLKLLCFLVINTVALHSARMTVHIASASGLTVTSTMHDVPEQLLGWICVHCVRIISIIRIIIRIILRQCTSKLCLKTQTTISTSPYICIASDFVIHPQVVLR